MAVGKQIRRCKSPSLPVHLSPSLSPSPLLLNTVKRLIPHQSHCTMSFTQTPNSAEAAAATVPGKPSSFPPQTPFPSAGSDRTGRVPHKAITGTAGKGFPSHLCFAPRPPAESKVYYTNPVFGSGWLWRFVGLLGLVAWIDFGVWDFSPHNGITL